VHQIVIVLPLPPSVLNPNNSPRTARGHKFKHFAKVAARKRAQTETWVMLGGKNGPMWPAALMRIRAFFPTMTFWDDDNLISACKPYRDGIARAGMVIDDKFIRNGGPVAMAKDAANPRVEIELTMCL